MRRGRVKGWGLILLLLTQHLLFQLLVLLGDHVWQPLKGLTREGELASPEPGHGEISGRTMQSYEKHIFFLYLFSFLFFKVIFFFKHQRVNIFLSFFLYSIGSLFFFFFFHSKSPLIIFFLQSRSTIFFFFFTAKKTAQG